jgi:hypothetical protein
MKHRSLVFVILAFSFNLVGQVEFGVKAGISSYNLAETNIIVPDQNLSISIHEAEYGHHLGVYSRLKISALYMEPALLFNSNKVSYLLEDYGESPWQTIKNETYNTLDIPVLLGLKLGPVRLQGGAVSHLFINSLSDFIDIKDYDQKFKKATYGFQAGLGLDIWKLRFDLNYEGNLTRWGDHIEIGGYPYSFSERHQRIVASVGYKF